MWALTKRSQFEAGYPHDTMPAQLNSNEVKTIVQSIRKVRSIIAGLSSRARCRIELDVDYIIDDCGHDVRRKRRSASCPPCTREYPPSRLVWDSVWEIPASTTSWIARP